MAPSPVTLQAVPNESIAIYKAIIRPNICSLKPNIFCSTPKEAIIAPPGTPGPATIETPNIQINPEICKKVNSPPVNNIIAIAQAVILMVLPVM